MTSAPGRQPKTLRPDQRSIAALTRHTAFWWDLWLALAFGIAMGVGGFLDSRFHPSSPYFIGGAALCGTLAIADWLAGRWLSDRARSDALGEIVRAVDPEETAAQLPFVLVALVGLGAAVWCGFGAIVIGGLSGKLWPAVISGLAVALVAWTVLGTLSLVILTFRITRLEARIRSIQERAERAQRLAAER